jgi:hypothetical protein
MIALGTLAHKVHCKTHICKLSKVSHQCDAGSGKTSEQGTAVIRRDSEQDGGKWNAKYRCMDMAGLAGIRLSAINLAINLSADLPAPT